MKLATSTGYFLNNGVSDAEAVRGFFGTGFRCLDACFYDTAENCMLAGADWRQKVLEMKQAAEQGGMTFVQAHSPGTVDFARLDFFIRLTRRSIEASEMLGIPAIVVHSQNFAGLTPQEMMEKNKAFFEALYPVMEKTGVHVLIENWPDAHAPAPNTRAFPSTADDLLMFLDFLGHPLLGACWDTGHGHMNGAEQYETISKLGKRLEAVHIQDNFGEVDQHLMPLVGTLDFDEVICGLLDIGFEGTFTFEADNILRQHDLPWELKQKSVELLYEVGKYLLKKHHCFEG